MDTQATRATGPIAQRIQAGTLLSTPDIAERIENMVASPEGTLRAVQGPTPILFQNRKLGYIPQYPGQIHGIHHTVFHGGRLTAYLIHAGTGIYVLNTKTNDWDVLIDVAAYSPPVTADIPDDTRPRIPTQFVSVPNGVVILPQDCRAYFYDGELVAPLGFDKAPGPPVGHGPVSSRRIDNTSDTTDRPGINDTGFAHDGQGYASTAMHQGFGMGRLGSVAPFTGVLLGSDADKNAENTVAGQLLLSHYQAAVQWGDVWGNLSPLSGRSAIVKFDQQQSRFYYPSDDPGKEWQIGRLEQVQKQIQWERVDTGPDPCTFRILYRTRDMVNSGTAKLFEVPINAQDGTFAVGTIPDNQATVFPDNVHDMMLVREAPRIRAAAAYALGCLWDGRLWTGRYLDSPGMVDYSLPGLWGTFDAETAFFPDARGAGVTGLHATSLGLLIFTEQSVFLIRRAVDSFNGYRRDQLSSFVGCIAPNSIVSMPDGTVVWLGIDGFYRFTGDNIEPISGGTTEAGPLEYPWRRVTGERMIQAVACYDYRSREYRCWLSVDGSETNNQCFTFDGAGWRQRSAVSVAAVCVTQDTRKYVLFGGDAINSDGNQYTSVWVMDRSSAGFVAQAQTAVVETAWLGAPESFNRRTTLVVELWLREYGKTSLTVELMSDYRPEVVDTADATTKKQIPWNYATDTPPSFWGVTDYDTTDAKWYRRRLFWRRVALYAPSCEAFKVRISGERWEFMGMRVLVNPKESGGGRMPP